MTTTTKNDVSPTREAFLNYAEANALFQLLCDTVLQVQTMDANCLMIFKAQVEQLKKSVGDNAEVKFLESVLGLIKAATKDAMFDMEHIFSADDDFTLLENDGMITTKVVKTVDCITPPKQGGITVGPMTKLYLTNDIVETDTVDGKEMAVITETAGASPIITMNVWGWTDEFPEAYNEEYQLTRPLSARARTFWKGEVVTIGNKVCGIIKLHKGKLNPVQKQKADKDLLANKK